MNLLRWNHYAHLCAVYVHSVYQFDPERSYREWAQRQVSRVIIMCLCCVPDIIDCHQRLALANLSEWSKNLKFGSKQTLALIYVRALLLHIIGLGLGIITALVIINNNLSV